MQENTIKTWLLHKKRPFRKIYSFFCMNFIGFLLPLHPETENYLQYKRQVLWQKNWK